MIDKRWIHNTKLTPDQLLVNQELAEALNINSSLAMLLIQRGVSSFEESRTFFRPDLSHLHDPYLMMDMVVAVKRLVQAINNKEKILVYGDYDVDGTTSVTLFMAFYAKFMIIWIIIFPIVIMKDMGFHGKA